MTEQFGRFAAFDDFLSTYVLTRRDREAEYIRSLPRDEAMRHVKNYRNRDVVEFKATIIDYQGVEIDGDGRHQQIVVRLTETLEVDKDVATDVAQALKSGGRVFVAVRFGDMRGLAEPIKGLKVGQSIHVRGEWVPQHEAYAHGGEAMPVVHFVHYPLGFLCTEEACYR